MNMETISYVPEEETIVSKNECVVCKCCISGKPWMTVTFEKDDYTVHACGYSCCNKLDTIIGKGYWKHVVNKEDFNEPRPVTLYRNKEDITANFGIDEIRNEIKDEEKRILEIEEEWECSSEYNSSEENN